MARRYATTIALLAMSSAAATATYEFAFETGSAHPIDDSTNTRTLTAVASLLHDYQSAVGLHFILIGQLPPACGEASECPEQRLLKQRVVTVIDRLMGAQPKGTNSAAQLRWESVVADGSRAETLWLGIRINESALWSAECPYHLQVNDPRLPPRLPTDGGDVQWIDLQGLNAVPLTAAAVVRVRLAESPDPSASISVIQVLDGKERVLGRSRAEVQWSANDIHWSSDAADIDIDPQLPSRDIGNALLPWDDADHAVAQRAAAPKHCRTHFFLAR